MERGDSRDARLGFPFDGERIRGRESPAEESGQD